MTLNPYSSTEPNDDDHPVSSSHDATPKRAFRWQVLPAMLSGFCAIVCLVGATDAGMYFPSPLRDWNSSVSAFSGLLTSIVIVVGYLGIAAAFLYDSIQWLRSRFAVAASVFSVALLLLVAAIKVDPHDDVYIAILGVVDRLHNG
jgi:hypothetical protein